MKGGFAVPDLSDINPGKVFREIREHHGISQREAANMLNISNVHLCNLENGGATPSFALLDKVEEVFKVRLKLSWEEAR